MTFLHLLIEPFHYPFMRAGLAAAVLAGVTCGSLGVYVVLRRVAYIGHALTHASLPGLALAYLAGKSPFAGALAADAATAAGIGWISRNEAVHEDTAIGVISNTMFALGLLVMAGAKTYRDLAGMLFGQILGVTPWDLAWMAAAAAVVVAALILLHKEWALATLDPGHARMIGLPVEALRLGFLVLLALAVATAVQAVGAVLTGALLIAPPAAARLFAQRLPGMMALSVLIAVACGVGGLYLSYFFSIPSGAAIVLLSALAFAAARLWSGRRAAS